VRGFWHEVTRNSSKLHEVLEVVKRFQACTYMVEFGYIHAVLWLNRAGGPKSCPHVGVDSMNSLT
jgi:hypothetical protein